MNLIKSTVALVVFMAVSNAAFAGGFEGMSLGEEMATRDCAWCHGQLGQGFATAPRLAGQTRLYIENQLVSFRAHTRDNPNSQQFMWGAAALLDARDAAELAAYFSSIAPEPANDGDATRAEIGRALFKDGNPSGNIPSCIACHGPNAEGVREMPRLGGLSYRYLRRKLAQWGQGYHLAAMQPMPEIAKHLEPEEIEALASFLSFVK